MLLFCRFNKYFFLKFAYAQDKHNLIILFLLVIKVTKGKNNLRLLYCFAIILFCQQRVIDQEKQSSIKMESTMLAFSWKTKLYWSYSK